MFYRLGVVPIAIPPLRDRLEDIELLATWFLGHYWLKYRPDVPMPVLHKSAIAALRAHPWPGNVRELQNTIEHAVVMLEPTTEIHAAQLPFDMLPVPRERDGSGVDIGGENEPGYHEARDRLLETFDREFLRRAITKAGGNVSKAARRAGIDRTSFYRLMGRHGLKPDVADRRLA